MMSLSELCPCNWAALQYMSFDMSSRCLLLQAGMSRPQVWCLSYYMCWFAVFLLHNSVKLL